MKCETCMANMAECPGHFGHLELAKPMFYIGFLKTVLSIMRFFCFNCSKILADEDHLLCGMKAIEVFVHASYFYPLWEDHQPREPLMSNNTHKKKGSFQLSNITLSIGYGSPALDSAIYWYNAC
ncbi:unnamed protein product [Fraxinus pennsylvanica]|uniref:DNA-directed RNA polymerase n=1 Tax=Fraxinus pennsylvanica TaxID=56036 RepID=A0AAD2E1Q1_9LAMI|nr:unnamed protein product [Fraxinus pennsylvanica]